MKGEIISETAKYIYTREVISFPVTHWFVVFPDGYCSQAYRTEAEAEQAGPQLAKLFHTRYVKVKSITTTEYEIKHHRYRR